MLTPKSKASATPSKSAPGTADKKPATPVPVKKPAPKPAIVSKSAMETKVTKQVLNEGLPIDKDK